MSIQNTEKEGVMKLINKSDIERVRALIEANIGSRIKITVKKGRKRVVVRYGTINAVYPFTFNVTIESISEFADTSRNVSLSYADVLTSIITLTLTDSDTENK